MTILGIDTSNHDIIDRNGGRNLDWAAIARAGVTFGWHKVSDGLNFYADPTAGMALAGMRANLGVWGGYHVLWGDRSITGQLDWYASILDRIAAGWRTDPRYVAVWDCEPFSYNTAPTIDQVNQAGDYWLRVTGRQSLGYCPPWHYGADLDRLRYPLISSNYGTNAAAGLAALYPGDTSGRWQATPRRQADVLQYGSNATAGPHRTCDGDAFRGTLDQLRALITGGTDVTTLDGDQAKQLASIGGVAEQVADVHFTTTQIPIDGERVSLHVVMAGLVGATRDNSAKILAALANLQPGTALTQDQINAGFTAALGDPAIQAGVGKAIGDAIAAHLH